MVYCGPPSKGCSSCRERKIKCDLREPGCGQCEKRASGPCPGYRNMVDLMFRDESSRVIRKATAKRSRKAAGPRDAAPVASGSMPDSASAGPAPPGVQPGPQGRTLVNAKQYIDLGKVSAAGGDPTGSSSDLARSSLMPSGSAPRYPSDLPSVARLQNPGPVYEDLGLAFFFSRYVSVNNTVGHTRFEFIDDVWRPRSLVLEQQTDGVMAGMTALGLAGLANLTKSTKMMHAARESYIIALRKTNRALRNPRDTAKDTTLLAVLILGVFETMTGQSDQTFKAWTEHINGAAALAAMRGEKQFQTDSGLRMFLLLTHSVMISCLQRGHPMPQSMVRLRAEASKYLPPNEPGWRITGTVHKLLQVQSDIKQGNITDCFEIVQKLTEIDDEFDGITKDFPAKWYPQIITVQHEHPSLFNRVCHLYPTQWHTKTWNGLRGCRIMVHEAIRSELLKGVRQSPPRFTPEDFYARYQTTRDTLAKLRDAVVCSVPQHFGLVKYVDKNGETLARIPKVELVRDAEGTPIPTMDPTQPGPQLSSDYDSPDNPMSPLPGAVPSDEERDRFLLLVSASNMLIWPLYITGMSSSCTPEIRTYVAGRLRALAAETGIMQAMYLADQVEKSGSVHKMTAFQLGPGPMDEILDDHLEEIKSQAREFKAFPVEV